MADSYVREIGRVADMDGDTVRLEVNYDAVVIRIGSRDGDSVHLTAAQAEEFARLFVSAVWQAGQQKGRMDEEAAVKGAFDMAPAMSSELPPRTCTCGQVPHDERCPALDDR